MCSRFDRVPDIFAVKLKSCTKSHRILDIFCLPNFKGVAPQKLYPGYHFNLAVRQVAKFCGAISATLKVLGTHSVNFKPIFNPPFEKPPFEKKL